MRKHTLLLIVLLGCAMQPPPAQAAHEWQIAMVKKVINAFKTGDVDRISSVIEYPLAMPYPLDSIDTPAEFHKRFKQVFDKKIIQRIASSTPSKGWYYMDWRGIMFDDGDIWLADDGKIRIVHYSTTEEQEALKNAINKDKLKLQPSMRHFTRPVLYWVTKSYRIRIDELADGNFRYASWNKGQTLMQTPSLVITNGVMEPDGEANYHYVFRHAGYRYVCYVNVIGTADEAPGELDVYKGQKLLMKQRVIRFYGDWSY